jgi:hypothetical protein
VGERYTVAIETALGGGMQNIVVDREEDGKAAIQYLKQRGAGRATFLPLSAVRANSLREQGVENCPGFVGIASGLVSCEERYGQVVMNQLGRPVVTEDMDSAIAMARQYHHRFKIVTLDGQVLNPGGSMTGGSASRSAGILSRSAELEGLEQRSAGVEQRLTERKKELEELQREVSAARYEVDAEHTQGPVTFTEVEYENVDIEGTKADVTYMFVDDALVAIRVDYDDKAVSFDEIDKTMTAAFGDGEDLDAKALGNAVYAVDDEGRPEAKAKLWKGGDVAIVAEQDGNDVDVIYLDMTADYLQK